MNRRGFLAAFATLGFASCMARDESQQARFEELEVEHMIVLVIDLSGSFHSTLLGEDGNGGKAFKTINKAIADFTEGGRDKAHDRIILAQISGRYPPSLLYDGKIADFEERFPDPTSLRTFLIANSHPDGSPVHLVVSQVLSYAINLHQQAPNAKSCIAIFSDFDDTYPGADQTREDMVKAINEYARVSGARGAFGAYWVDLAYVPGLITTLQKSGFKPHQYVVESGINDSPRLPKFD